MVQVQLRIPEESISEIDKWVSQGKFKSRSDAIRTILALLHYIWKKRRPMSFTKCLMKEVVR
ncbi:MAG: hypothetical protein AYK18_04565 [Theionarchaea archaeon DG-70]|nr:MAG: hypothetical protein AYK18_04565 [Theionarchaea archaeon DG-70]